VKYGEFRDLAIRNTSGQLPTMLFNYSSVSPETLRGFGFDKENQDGADKRKACGHLEIGVRLQLDVERGAK
jgi:hypothetical protein